MLGAIIKDERGLAKYSTKSSDIPCGCDKTLTGRSDLSIPNTLTRVPVITSSGAVLPSCVNSAK